MAVVRVHEPALQAGIALAAVHFPGHDRTGIAAEDVVGIGAQGELEPERVLTTHGQEGLVGLIAAPTEIGAGGHSSRPMVQLLPALLAHITDPQVTVQGVDADPVRVAQPIGPDLGPAAGGVVRERIVRRYGVGAVGLRTDADDGPEQGAGLLTLIARITRTTAITQRAIQHAIRPELEVAALMDRVRLGQFDQHQLTVRVGHVRVRRHLEPRDPTDPVRTHVRRVMQVEVPVVGIVRMEGHAKQPPLPVEDDPVPDVEEGNGQHGHAVRDHLHQSSLPGHEQPIVPAVRDGGDVLHARCPGHQAKPRAVLPAHGEGEREDEREDE